MTGDYSDHAMYGQAMDAYDDPDFAAWLCETYPWGGVDMGRARAQYLSLEAAGQTGSGHSAADLDGLSDQDAIIALEKEFSGWLVFRGTDQLCHARHHQDDTHIRGEDWTDLRDQIRGHIGRQT